jgi:hypothetical protein
MSLVSDFVPITIGIDFGFILRKITNNLLISSFDNGTANNFFN